MATDLGSWQPLEPAEVVELFAGSPVRWWIAGGHALELHLGRSWRSHDDIDVGVARRDAAALVGHLAGWDVHIAAAGRLTPWDGRPLDASRHENNLWCRPDDRSAWSLDVLVGDGNAREWIFRRDGSIRRPWSAAVLSDRAGRPYLAPELQLLFKSRTVRPKDRLDAANVVPQLEPERRRWLADHLEPGHEWRRLVDPLGS